MTPLDSGPSTKIPPYMYLEKADCNLCSENLRKMVILYENIYPKDSQPARIYGLPKMHKYRGPNSTPPFRPIVSSIGTYNYNLAKYLCNFLLPHIPTGCNACYVGEITQRFSTRVREHLVSDRASHIFKHLQNSEQCRALSSGECFHISTQDKRSFSYSKNNLLLINNCIT